MEDAKIPKVVPNLVCDICMVKLGEDFVFHEKAHWFNFIVFCDACFDLTWRPVVENKDHPFRAFVDMHRVFQPTDSVKRIPDFTEAVVTSVKSERGVKSILKQMTYEKTHELLEMVTKSRISPLEKKVWIYESDRAFFMPINDTLVQIGYVDLVRKVITEAGASDLRRDSIIEIYKRRLTEAGFEVVFVEDVAK